MTADAPPRDRVQGIELTPLTALRPHPENPRKISRPALEQLKAMLEADPDMLQTRPLIALPGGTVVAGNQRLVAARELGWETIPVATVELSDDEARVWMLRDNAPSGEWDDQLLAEAMVRLEVGTVDLALTGFDSRSVDEILRSLRVVVADPDDAPPLPAVPRSKPGEVYELGAHRLMCGDATDADAVAALLAGAKPNLCLTDPPYGVSYDPKWRQDAADAGHLAYATRRVGEVRNDDRADWSDAWRLVPGDVIYAWSPPGSTRALHQHALEDAGFEVRMEMIWVKPHLPISRGHYHVRHEPCFYAVRAGATASWVGDRKQTTIWDISLDANVAGGHSTQKPVECFSRAIVNHQGDVYDPFSGTGSSLIAAEMAGRRCFAMEIDPAYCDVIRDRYQAFSA